MNETGRDGGRGGREGRGRRMVLTHGLLVLAVDATRFDELVLELGNAGGVGFCCHLAGGVRVARGQGTRGEGKLTKTRKGGVARARLLCRPSRLSVGRVKDVVGSER